MRLQALPLLFLAIAACTQTVASSSNNLDQKMQHGSDVHANAGGPPGGCADPNMRPVAQITKLMDGTMHLDFTNATPLGRYDIQATDQLVPAQWNVLDTKTADAMGAFSYDDTDAPNHDMRYYRAAGKGPDMGCACPTIGNTVDGPEPRCPLGDTLTTSSAGFLQCCPCTANDCGTDFNCCATNACNGNQACEPVVCKTLPEDCGGKTDTDCDDDEDCDMHCCACYASTCQ